MNNIKNNIKLFAAAAVVGALSAGCSMELTPLNEVVLENYWTQKSEVQSCMNSCYYGLQEGGYVKNLIVWGEVRSDNVDEGNSIPTTLQDVLNGGLKTTNPYCNWAAQYTVINRCNTVLHYAPGVAKKDPNYTTSDLNVTIAECKALRAFSYLTLVKTFKDVPFSFEPSIDDTQEYRVKATPFAEVIDKLIDDLEPVKNYAPKKNIYRDGVSANIQSTGRITRPAMYALLAELYLWKASDADRDVATKMEAYRKCIECCDWIIDFKISQKESENFPEGSGIDYDKDFDPKVYSKYGIPLLREGGASGSVGTAFKANFGTGNSFESIFEISYMNSTSDTYKKNDDVMEVYGGINKNKQDVAPVIKGNNKLCPEELKSKEYNDKNLFSTLTDYRALFPFLWADGGSFYITKYVQNGILSAFAVPLQSNTWPAKTNKVSDPEYSAYLSTNYNWIVYRLSEIILFRAEAEIELAGLINETATPSEDEGGEEGEGEGGETPARPRKAYTAGASLGNDAAALYDDAFNLIRAVYERSNPDADEKGCPNRANYSTHKEMANLLLAERRREFLFEGKRYYDLVRLARRAGNTEEFKSIMSGKFGGTSAAIRVKMTMMDFLYMPYAKSQMKLNPNLVQNSAFEDEEESVKN